MTDSVHKNIEPGLYWTKVFEEFMQTLNIYALRLSNGRSYDADDLRQETFCRALAYSENPECIRNPLGYLLRSMRNIWITKWHKENTAHMESLDELQDKMALTNHPTVDSDVFRILENEELAHQLKTIRGPLSDREIKLLELYLEGYKCKEMADILQENVRVIQSDLNAVKSKVHQRIKSSSTNIKTKQTV
jgi:RNA polymerase sigma factor (sigma-70 family)